MDSLKHKKNNVLIGEKFISLTSGAFQIFLIKGNNNDILMWYPDFEDIILIFKRLQKEYKNLRNAVLLNEKGVKSILDKVKFGLPFKKIGFWEKVAILWFDLTNEHHFLDGNKRIGFIASQLFLKQNGYHLKSSEKTTKEKIIEFCLKIAREEIDQNEISRWIRKNYEKF